jgi:hypothetical protein
VWNYSTRLTCANSYRIGPRRSSQDIKNSRKENDEVNHGKN